MPLTSPSRQAKALTESVIADPSAGFAGARRASARRCKDHHRKGLTCSNEGSPQPMAKFMGSNIHRSDFRRRRPRSLRAITLRFTAVAAVVTTSEIYIEHYKASFGTR